MVVAVAPVGGGSFFWAGLPELVLAAAHRDGVFFPAGLLTGEEETSIPEPRFCLDRPRTRYSFLQALLTSVESLQS